MNVALIMTAVQQGAVVANHVEVTELLKDAEGKVKGTRMRDVLTGEEWTVAAKVLHPPSSPAPTNATHRESLTPRVPSPTDFAKIGRAHV